MKNATGLGAHRYRSHGVVGKHRTAAPIVTPEPRTFDCQVCSKKFVSPEMLNVHMAGHGTEQLIDQVGAMIRAAFAAKDGTIKELRTKQARMEKALGKVVAEL
jgi:NADPH-dependent ferric siderophore reductase